MVLYKRADMDLSWCLWSCLLRCALLVAWRKGVASAQRSSFSSGEGKVGASKGGFFLLLRWGVAMRKMRCRVTKLWVHVGPRCQNHKGEPT